MLHPRVSGRWLRSLGPFGPVTITHSWPGGLESASWEMDPKLQHPTLRANAPVTIYDGGHPIGVGTLAEPSADGQYNVVGLYRQADRAPALTSAGSFTSTPDAAIDGAIARGEVTWTRSASLSNVAFTPTADGSQTLADLLTTYCAQNGLRWGVNAYREVYAAADPTVPQWHVPHAVQGRGLVPAEDEFYTHISGRFVTGWSAAGPSYDIRTVGSADAANYFGRKSIQIELDDLGVIDGTKATDFITGIFLKSGARMGWGEGLELGKGQIVTPGRESAALEQVQAGQMIRLKGAVDNSRAYKLPINTDIVIAESTYTDRSGRIQLKPVGMAARNFQDVLKAALDTALA